MICLSYCFPFFLVIVTFFDVASCNFKLKDFNCSDSLVPLLSTKLGHYIGAQSHIWKSQNDAYQEIIFLDKMTRLLSLLTHFDFASVLSHYIATYDIHSLLLVYLNFHVFMHSFQMINISDRWENFLQLDLMTRLPHDPSIGRILFGNNNKSDKSMFLFHESIFLSVFFWRKTSSALISLFFANYLVVSHSAYISDKTTSWYDSWLRKNWWYTSSIINNDNIIRM